jgi:hypothetical protein
MITPIMNGNQTKKRLSTRFNRYVQVTYHARERMEERQIIEELLYDLLETGKTRYKDECRLWLFKAYPDRDDNDICAAVVLEDELVVKTIMHRWELQEDRNENSVS